MIKVICFDLDGVFFIRPHEDFAHNYAQKYGLDEEFVKDVLFNRAEKEGGYDKLKMGKPNNYWQWEFKTLGLEGKITKEERMNILLNGYKINPQIPALISQLKQSGYKTATISNRYKENTDYLEKKFHFRKFFDYQIFSHDVGLLKPDRKIFGLLVKLSGVAPAEILYSDDDDTKVKGAFELGINVFVYKNYQDFLKELHKHGVRF
jgi:HAD superfamily hydrolase (TIGR01509 family)